MSPRRKRSLLVERFHPAAEIFPLMTEADAAGLAVDIAENGLHDPIIEFDGLILDGRNRYRACIIAGVEPRFRAYEGADPVGFVLSANLHRRHLNESQRGMVMARLATNRQGRPNAAVANPAVMVQADAAKALAVGVRTGQRARVVLDKGVPDLVRRVDQGELPVHIAAQVALLPKEVQEQMVAEPEPAMRSALKQYSRARREEGLAVATAEASRSIGSALYSVILADPPWRFEPRSRKTGMDRAADNHYPTMTVDDICRIVPPAAEDCALFLWATAPMLPEALQVIGAWGFAYKSHFIWEKDRAGTGYWNRNRHELLLIATRGQIPAPAPGEQFDSVIAAEVGAHSAKPFIFTEMIDEMFPNARPLEMFARGPAHAGWDCWGNQAEHAA